MNWVNQFADNLICVRILFSIFVHKYFKWTKISFYGFTRVFQFRAESHKFWIRLCYIRTFQSNTTFRSPLILILVFINYKLCSAIYIKTVYVCQYLNIGVIFSYINGSKQFHSSIKCIQEFEIPISKGSSEGGNIFHIIKCQLCGCYKQTIEVLHFPLCGRFILRRCLHFNAYTLPFWSNIFSYKFPL